MPLTVASEVAYISAAPDDFASGRARYGCMAPPLLDSDILRTKCDELRFGRERYPLWHSTVGRLLPEPQTNRYCFRLDGLASIAGEGETPQEALTSFREQFHTRFQELIAKRPFEMEAKERAVWEEIRRLVNVELYRSELPILVRQFGEVVSVRTGHRSVRWEGTGRESIDLQKFPGEFASFREGQPFEAYVERDQQNMRINQVLHVRRTSRPAHHNAADNTDFASSLGSNKDLPVTSLD